jgi:hypothetical protein
MSLLRSLPVAFCLLAVPAAAQTGAHTHPDLEAADQALQGQIDALQQQLDALEAEVDGYHAPPPPVDNPPTVANLTASCDEEVPCSNDIGAADDSGSFTVAWAPNVPWFTGNPDGTWAALPPDGAGFGTFNFAGTVDDGVNAPVAFTLVLTVNDTVPPPPPPSGNLQDILDMPAGSWLAYGDPWSVLETSGDLERDRDNCDRQLDAIIGAWNGLAWDGQRWWNFAGGGHGDGCFNGVLSYDLEAGQPSVEAPHAVLNMPLLWTFASGTDGWNEPYVSETPWAACAGQGPNCDDLTKAERLANGPAFPNEGFLTDEGLGTELYGAFLRPRSSHYYNNIIRDGDWLYLLVGQTFGGTKNDSQVWRYNVVTGVFERLPNRHNGADQIGGYNANLVKHPDGRVLMFSGAKVCEADLAGGVYNCTNHSINITNAATLAWDDDAQGFWAIDPQLDRLVFLSESGGNWTSTTAIVDSVNLKKSVIGSAGICLVPTDTGTNPVIFGGDGRLLRWDGTALTEVTGQTGQPLSSGTVLNKWRWNDDLGVCLGAFRWDQGISVWRPDFSNWEEASNPPPPPPSGDNPTFAGVEVKPVDYPIATYDQPATFQPEAPDIAAICPGPWTELHYTNDAELAQSNAQTQVDSARVFIHAQDGGVAYTEKVAFNGTRCIDLVGVPHPVTGDLPILQRSGNDIDLPKTGDVAIIRYIDTRGGGISWGCHVPTGSCPQALVLQGNRIIGGHLFGDADPSYDETYLEMVANDVGPNLDWHIFYLERNTVLVARGNRIYGSDSFDKHAFKNLANRSIMEGNVFSNVGLDGQSLGTKSNGDPIIGAAPLDLYGCTDSVFRNNIVLFRTSGSNRAFLQFRNRNAWNACNKGERQADGSRTLWQPEDPSYQDPVTWGLIDTALQAGLVGYTEHLAEDWLFTHLVEGNTFIVFQNQDCGGTPCTARAADMDSLRPLADNTQEAAFKVEYDTLAALCAGLATYAERETCWLANASPEATYVFDHIDPNLQPNLVNNADPPNGQPILAPAEWRERYTVFWGQNQTYITCDADGLSCALDAPFALDASSLPWDAVQVAHAPRLLPYTAP